MTDRETVIALLDLAGVEYRDYGYALGELGWSLSFDWTGAIIGGNCSLPPRWYVRDGKWYDLSGEAATLADAEAAPRGMI